MTITESWCMMFEPYIKEHGISDLRFFFATPEARAWYDPLKPYTLLEYEWVLKNVRGDIIVDAGCHHGNYAVLFWKSEYIECIDIVKSNVDICEMNLLLNGYVPGDDFNLHHHRLEKGAGYKVLAARMLPDVYKMDIEGAEFELMPDEIDDLPSVHTWIVEIHPNAGNPDVIAGAFADRGFELLKVDRERMTVRPYTLGEHWLTHATLIARRGN